MSQELSYNPKITIAGSGNIGLKLFETLRRQYPGSQITVCNRESEKAIGGAISSDQSESISHKLRRGHDEGEGQFIFTNDTEAALRGADIVVVTAGVPRKSPTQPRTELAKDNIPVIDEIAKAAGKIAREDGAHQATYIIATNPIGLIDQRFQEISEIPHDRIMGLSGELDVERLRQSIRTHLHVGYDDIRGERILGDHGPNMVPVLSQIEIRKNGQWQKLLDMPEYKDNEILQKEFKSATITGGGKFAKWTGQSDFRGPAAALAYMVEQVADARWGDKEASLPITASTFLPDANIYSGQTVRINENGTHSLADTPALSPSEQAALDTSISKAKDDKTHFNTLARLGAITGTTEQGNAAGL